MLNWNLRLPLPWALLASAALAGTLPTTARTEEIIPRSLAQTRPRQFDELKQPRYIERENHRGWQLRFDTFQVFANSSPDDAEWAAENTREAWQTMAQLADFWTRQHRRANFAYGSTLVVVDGQPDLPIDKTPPTMQLTGTQLVIHLRMPDDLDEIDDEQQQQLTAQLRHATAHAFLHASQMDQKLPAWVCEGLARYVCQMGLEPEFKADTLKHLGPPSWLRAQYDPEPPESWRTTGPDHDNRPADDGAADDGPADDGAEHLAAAEAADEGSLDERQRPADTVWFLLEGDDARHSGNLFTALRRTINEAQTADRQRMPGRGPVDWSETVVRAERIEQLADDTQPAFKKWRQDPLAGQPRRVDSDLAATDHSDRQRQMAFVLKLLNRFAESPRSGVQPRVREFGKPDPQLGMASSQPGRFDLPQLHRRLLDDNQFWATIAPDSAVLVSFDQEQVRAWIDDLLDPRYQAELAEGNWRLTYRLADGSQLRAQWLPAEKPSLRPTVKYELLAAAPR